jgi:hypothetical protein
MASAGGAGATPRSLLANDNVLNLGAGAGYGAGSGWVALAIESDFSTAAFILFSSSY